MIDKIMEYLQGAEFDEVQDILMAAADRLPQTEQGKKRTKAFEEKAAKLRAEAKEKREAERAAELAELKERAAGLTEYGKIIISVFRSSNMDICEEDKATRAALLLQYNDARLSKFDYYITGYLAGIREAEKIRKKAERAEKAHTQKHPKR